MNRKHELSVEAIEAWKNDLPLSDLAASTKAMYLLFEEIRASDLSAQRRFDVLCALRPTLSYLGQALRKFYSTQEVLTEQQILISDLSEGLYQEMFDGFKTIVNGCEHSIFKRKLLLYALQNAMHYCTALLFHAYQQHRQPTPGIWLELHSLYIFAQKKHLISLPLPKVSEWNYQLKNLDQIYKHCLLFVLSSPYRLRREHIIYLIYALEAWTSLLGFSKTDSENALFIVDYESDAPPQYATLAFHPRGQFSYLHLEKVNRRLYKLLNFRKTSQTKESKEFTDAECKLPLSFIESLLSSWQHMSERTSPRHKAHDFVTVSLTIASVHWFLRHPEDTPERTPQEDERPNHYTAEVIDESEGGYCLKWVEKVPNTLQSGEIIGIANVPEQGKKTWSIGTIRWLKQEKDNSIYIGVQILSHNALPVTAKLADSETSHPIATLMLPNTQNKPLTLITPSLPFKPGQEIDIQYLDKHYLSTLQRTRGISPSYQEFELEFTYEPFVFADLDENDTAKIAKI